MEARDWDDEAAARQQIAAHAFRPKPAGAVAKATAPARPRWKRKRGWIVAAALLLPAAYAAGDGPAFYAVHRGWLPFEKWQAAYTPWRTLVNRSPAAEPYGSYVVWVCRTAGRHRKAAESQDR